MKAVLFDFDGIIADSEPYQFESLKLALMSFGYKLSKKEFIKQWIQEGFTYEKAIVKYSLKANPKQIWKKKYTAYKEMMEKKMKLMPHAKKCITNLNKKYKLGLATNSNYEEVIPLLNKYHIKNYFRAIITWEDYTKRKPNPECYLKAARQLRIKPKECVVIEDSIRGMNAAKNGKMKCIIVPNKFTIGSHFFRTDLIAGSLNEITPKLIESLR